EWHATGQLALIDVATKFVKTVGAPAMIRAIDVSPNGQYLRVTRMTKPFAYIVPVSSFGQIEEVWDTSGKALAKISERALNLGAIPDDPNDPNAGQGGGGVGGRGGANQTGKRELTWASDGQGMTYLEQQPAPANTTNNTGNPDANAAGGGGGRAAGGGGGRAG